MAFPSHVPQCSLRLAGSLSAVPVQIFYIRPRHGRPAALLANRALYSSPSLRITEGDPAAFASVRGDFNALGPSGASISLSVAQTNIAHISRLTLTSWVQLYEAVS
jgi:hypothetical protein